MAQSPEHGPPRRGCLARAFINQEERRLRSGWRVLLYGLLFLAAQSLAAPAVRLAFPASSVGAPLAQGLYVGGYLASVVAVTWLARRFIDRRGFLNLGLRPKPLFWADLLVGVALGALLMAGIFAVQRAAGWLELQRFAWEEVSWQKLLPQLAASLWLYLVVAVNEELMVRGYVLQNLAEWLNMCWALVISSAVFGLLHAANPHATWVSTLNLAVAGIFLASGYLVTGSLWLPMGLHFGWNFFQGTVFGFPVSGTGGFHLIRHSVTGPSWATGGRFGPEAGLPGLAAMVLGTLVIWLWGHIRRDRVAAQSAGRQID